MKKICATLALVSLLAVSAPAPAANSRANCIGEGASGFGAMAILEALRLIGGRLFGEVARTDCDPDFE